MYLSLFTLSTLALLSDWLAQTGELYVDVDLPHSGGGSFSYFVQSMPSFRNLIAQQDWPEIEITVFRNKQFPLRGIVDDSFINQALQHIPDRQSYTILCLKDNYSHAYGYHDSGNRHESMKIQLEEVRGQDVVVGQDPIERYKPEKAWKYHDEVFVVSVLKNQNYYEKYKNAPQKYEWLAEMWYSK
jgi:hypothetical protein